MKPGWLRAVTISATVALMGLLLIVLGEPDRPPPGPRLFAQDDFATVCAGQLAGGGEAVWVDDQWVCTGLVSGLWTTAPLDVGVVCLGAGVAVVGPEGITCEN